VAGAGADLAGHALRLRQHDEHVGERALVAHPAAGLSQLPEGFTCSLELVGPQPERAGAEERPAKHPAMLGRFLQGQRVVESFLRLGPAEGGLGQQAGAKGLGGERFVAALTSRAGRGRGVPDGLGEPLAQAEQHGRGSLACGVAQRVVVSGLRDGLFEQLRGRPLVIVIGPDSREPYQRAGSPRSRW
jgi:hypothetical protein